jgi:PPOX class probable F420-dependent enzyme
MELPQSARDVLEGDAVATLATLNADGSPHLSVAWVGLQNDELVIGTLPDQRKIRNVRRDPRVALSLQTGAKNRVGLDEYLVINGQAVVEEGGAPELLQRLAHTYIGPGVTFPPMPDPPPGFVTRISVDSIGGVGPWSER